MRRPNYGAVTGVTGVLVVVCAVRTVFLPYIPPANPDIALWGRGEFVQRATTQAVDWRPLDQAVFDEAQRLSRPVIIVVGVPWSGVGRQADDAFSRPDVARALNRGFIAVRIDGAQDPRWLSQFLPLQRTRTSFSVGFQAWIFDLKNQLIDFMARVDAKDQLRETAVLDALLKAKGDFADAALADATPSLQLTQDADRDRLLQPAVADLSLDRAAPTLAAGMDPDWGGWNVRGLVVGRPLTLRFLQLAGRWSESGASLRHTVLSPRADWLDGGFYRVARKDTETPEYDKPTVLNAQTAEALAMQDAARPDPLLRKAARATVDWLLSLRDGDLVPGAEEGDEDERGRSHRASFSPLRLRDAVGNGTVTAEARAWAESDLGLGGPAHLLLPTLASVSDARLGGTLTALRSAAGPRRKTVAAGLCDVNGAIAACLLRCARLWDDPALAMAGGDMVDRLESFRGPSGFRHSLADSGGTLPYLGDALAYADAQLEDFLTNGRAPSLERGASALRGALKSFYGPEPGLLRPSPVGTMLMPHVAEVPQVTDDEREALSATALRLLDAYATVLGPDGREFATAALDVDARLGAVADAVPAMGGALGALVRHADSSAALVVGPDAAARAARLARRLPNRLVVPVLGAARPDLRGRRAGVYLLTPGGLAGPLSEAEAARRLPPWLNVAGVGG